VDSFLLNTYSFPVPKATLIRGDGARVTDINDKTYLDFLAGIAVVGLGHANKEIAERIAEQSAKLVHTSNFFLNEYTEKVAAKIDEHISNGTNNHGKVFFANSGAEANECAIKLAKLYGKNKRYKILTATNSFHGRTLATLRATGQPKKHEKFEPFHDFVNYFKFGNIESLKQQIDDECVAVLIEPIQGEGGVNVATQEFFDQLGALCKEHDLLLILDEIQTGMCRTGAWFAFHHYGLDPDVVTLAKALGNGFPTGACWIKDKVQELMGPGDHGSTYGGGPLALSVVDKVFDIMERDNIADHVSKVGAYFQEKLKATGLFREVRGKGLIIAVEIDNSKVDGTAPQFIGRCQDNGLILNALNDSAIRIVPPLIITEADIDEAIDIMVSSSKGN
jgi:predicted acetylornithine/succinylornithine family transaminase